MPGSREEFDGVPVQDGSAELFSGPEWWSEFHSPSDAPRQQSVFLTGHDVFDATSSIMDLPRPLPAKQSRMFAPFGGSR